MASNGPKWVHFTCLGTPNGLGSFLQKPIFDLFLIFKAFGDFRKAKTGHNELKMRQKHLFWHSMWSKIIFENNLFFLHPVDLVDPFWHPSLWATSCIMPQPTGPRYGRLGVG